MSEPRRSRGAYMGCVALSHFSMLAFAACGDSPVVPRAPVAVETPPVAPAAEVPPPAPVAIRFEEIAGRDFDTLRVGMPIDGAPSRGASEPLVTMIVFVDMECPFSKRAYGTMRELATLYPDTLRIAVRHHPLAFHPSARPLAAMLLEARVQGGDAGFFRLYDAIFTAERMLNERQALALTGPLGFDDARMATAGTNAVHLAALEHDFAVLLQTTAEGVPTSFINGRMVRGAVPLDDFRAVIDEEILLAERALPRGVPRARIFEAALADALALADAHALREHLGQPLTADQDVVNVPVEGFPTRGRATAPVTIVAFTDLDGPFSARVAKTLADIEHELGGDIRIVVRNGPHERDGTSLSTEAALEAFAQRGDVAYFRYEALLYANRHAHTRADLEAYARRIHLDLERFRHALDTHVHAARIAEGEALARDLGIADSPAIFVNGRMVRGALPWFVFGGLVDRARAEARGRREVKND